MYCASNAQQRNKKLKTKTTKNNSPNMNKKQTNEKLLARWIYSRKQHDYLQNLVEN